MKKLSLLTTILPAALLLGSCNTTTTIPAGSSGLASGNWTPNAASTIKIASVTNGPWTLQSGGATLANPYQGYCVNGALAQNTSKTLMQPYYFPFITGTGNNLDGYFDYRVKDQDEAVIHATTTDGGLTWTTDGTKLRLNAGSCATAAKPDPAVTDNGQGHPTVLTINTASGTKKLLYTLDRVSAMVDSGGLLIHDLASGFGALKDNEPVTDAAPLPTGISQTSGLQNPDGILGAVPGTNLTAGDPLKVIYLKKLKGSKTALPAGETAVCTDDQSNPLTTKTANYDLTEMRMASTTDGVNFTDQGPLTGLNNPNDTASNGFRFIGPRGTILKYNDGSYGLFFSGGNCSDGDSDAYHFIGYATSPDAVKWTVVNGSTNPLVQVDYSYPSATPAAYYSGRVYDPNVTLNGDGTLRLFFSGYHTGKPLIKPGVSMGSPAATFQGTDVANYRSILMLDLHR